MKICYLADAGSVHTQRWVKYFADNGHEVHLISFRSLDGNIENVKLYVLKRLQPQIRIISFSANLLFDMIQVKKIIKKIKPDILHAHYITDNGMLGALCGFHPFVITAWGSDVLVAPKKYKISKRMVKYALKRADLITCDGENSKDIMINLGIIQEKIKLIYHGVDTKEFSPKQRNNKFREELKTFYSPIVISNRKLEPVYNVESLIKAIPLVLKDFPEGKFVIGGKGSQEIYLKKLAKSIGVLDSIRFIEWLPRNEFIRCLASVDIYVSTSLSDGGISVSTTEAMACGLPVVVTDSGDNKKWIKDGENGFVVPIRDPNALAKRIVYLIQNENIRKRFGKINRKIIEEKAEYKKEMEKMEKIYEEVIAGFHERKAKNKNTQKRRIL